MTKRKLDIVAYAVVDWTWDNPLHLSSDEYTTEVQVEGKRIQLNARPAIAVYETESAAKERAREIWGKQEPARVVRVRIRT